MSACCLSVWDVVCSYSPVMLFPYICAHPSLLRRVYVLVCGNCIPYLVCTNVRLSSLSPLSSLPVLAELQQADLITIEECKGLNDLSDVATVQRDKFPEVQSKTADVLRSHGFVEESNLLAGKQTQSLIHVPVVCVVQWRLVVRVTRGIHHYCVHPAPSAGL